MKVVVWNENVHEKKTPGVADIYPDGIHGCIASFLRCDDIEVKTATLDEPECGLTDDVLKETDVLIWWGHCAHASVPDEVVDRVYKYVMQGMGFIALHSTHHSKIFKKLMGTTCNLLYNECVRERIWTIKPNHPIAEGVDSTFVLDPEEMYGEIFDIPEPMETLFIGWFNTGHVFRSGCTWVKGNGKVFYFQPGHETTPTFLNENVQKIIKNAVYWACPKKKNFPIVCCHTDPVE